MLYPISECSFIISNSSSVNFPVFFKIESGIPTFPISCIGEAIRRLFASFLSIPQSKANNLEYSATLFT